MLRTETSRAASMGQFPKTEHSVSRHDEYGGPDLTTVRRPRDERKSSPMGPSAIANCRERTGWWHRRHHYGRGYSHGQ